MGCLVEALVHQLVAATDPSATSGTSPMKVPQ
jgi:hypothetical protein